MIVNLSVCFLNLNDLNLTFAFIHHHLFKKFCHLFFVFSRLLCYLLSLLTASHVMHINPSLNQKPFTVFFSFFQKQPGEVYCKRSEIHKTHWKTPVPESFLIKPQASACNFIKKETLELMVFCEFLKIIFSQNTST